MKARPQGSAISGSTSTAKQASFDNLAAYCPDLEQWPRSWRGEEHDVGEKIVDGILSRAKRRAYTRGPERRPILDMLMVFIDISDVSFT
jgi:hypothetical protein